jgi:hypothetical protein
VALFSEDLLKILGYLFMYYFQEKDRGREALACYRTVRTSWKLCGIEHVHWCIIHIILILIILKEA